MSWPFVIQAIFDFLALLLSAGIILWMQNRKQDSDAGKAERDKLKVSIEQMAAKMIDGEVKQINSGIRRIEQRLENGDENFGLQRDRIQQMELKATTQLHQLSEWVIMNMVSKADFKSFEESVSKNFKGFQDATMGMSNAIAGLNATLKTRMEGQS